MLIVVGCFLFVAFFARSVVYIRGAKICSKKGLLFHEHLKGLIGLISFEIMSDSKNTWGL
jgi:hypothetical protein